MSIAWNDDPPALLPLIAQNVARVSRTIVAQAHARTRPSLDLAFDWHRNIYRSVPLPVPYYAGEIRDSDLRFPELIGYNVEVGGLPGIIHTNVPAALVAFEQAMFATTGSLDRVILTGVVPGTPATLAAVIRLAAYAHGEWVRIHPFANGNGRTARCWANFIALRYGLPAFVSIKPRPAGIVYEQAGISSMSGDHRLTEGLFAAMLNAVIPGP